jgi:hypothetical protein
MPDAGSVSRADTPLRAFLKGLAYRAILGANLEGLSHYGSGVPGRIHVLRRIVIGHHGTKRSPFRCFPKRRRQASETQPVVDVAEALPAEPLRKVWIRLLEILDDPLE